MDTPTIVTLTGPSSSGKTVLASILGQQEFCQLVSTTTRARRAGEKDGVDYNFVDTDAFEKDVAAGRFIEIVDHGGHRYGVHASEVERAAGEGRPAVLVVAPDGMAQVRAFCEEHGWKHLAVFVNNPADLLLRRMIERTVADVRALGKGAAEEKVAGKIDANAKRIECMLWDEIENWVKPALSGEVVYDLVKDRFDASNTQAVVEEVRELTGAKPSAALASASRSKRQVR